MKAKTESTSPITKILKAFLRHPKWNNAIIKTSWRKVSKLERRLKDLLYKDAKTRILDFIKEYVKENRVDEKQRISGKNNYQSLRYCKTYFL